MFCIEKMQITSIYGVHTGAASGGTARFFACLDEDRQVRVCGRRKWKLVFMAKVGEKSIMMA